MKFTDHEGRAWTPEVNVLTIGRVRKALGVNLLELLVPENELATRLEDPCLLVDVLFLLCADEAERRELDDAAFGRAMSMDAIEAGWDAVLEGLVNFSPSGLRPAHQKLLTAARKYREKQNARLKALSEGTDFDQVIEQAIERKLAAGPPPRSPTASGAAVSSLPAASASPPAG